MDHVHTRHDIQVVIYLKIRPIISIIYVYLIMIIFNHSGIYSIYATVWSILAINAINYFEVMLHI